MIHSRPEHYEPIGVDIGTESVRMIQLATRGKSLRVHAAARQALPEEARQNPSLRIALAIDVVRKMLRSGGFHGRQVVAALPREIVYYKNTRLPMMPVAEIEQAADFEAKNIFPFDTSGAFVRFIPAGEVRSGSETKQEVLLVAAKRAAVDEFIEQLHRAGVTIDSLDIEPAAIFRATDRFIRRKEDEQEVQVLVDIGYGKTQVVIGKKREISFYKIVELGGKQLNEAVARKLGITVDEARAVRRRCSDTPAAEGAARRDPVRQAVTDATRGLIEDLGREVSLCLRYHSVTFRGHRPTRVQLLGGEGQDTLIQSLLTAALTVPVEAGRPLANVDTAAMPIGDGGVKSEWVVAFGLGLRNALGPFTPFDGKTREQQRLEAEAVAAEPSAIETEAAVA